MNSSSGWYIHTFSSSLSSLVAPFRCFFFFGGTCARKPASATIACSSAAFGSSSSEAVDERKTRERNSKWEKLYGSFCSGGKLGWPGAGEKGQPLRPETS